MLQLTIITRILFVFGAITFLPLLGAQLVILLKLHGQKAKDILIGKGENWRDKTHFRSAYAFAWADWIIEMPLMVAGTVGVISGHEWDYILWAAAGVISVYINIFLWFFEKEYIYPVVGPLAYYTYFGDSLLDQGDQNLGIDLRHVLDATLAVVHDTKTNWAMRRHVLQPSFIGMQKLLRYNSRQVI